MYITLQEYLTQSCNYGISLNKHPPCLEWARTPRMSAHLSNKHSPPPNKRAPLVHDVKQVPLSNKHPHPLPLPCPPSLS